jgi:excisionase family DNA binding protein
VVKFYKKIYILWFSGELFVDFDSLFNTSELCVRYKFTSDLSEAAHLLKVSRQRVHVMLQSGKLDGVKVGSTWIIHRDSVEGYMARK